MMGASRRPPPPSALPPISSKAKDYSMDRPSEVQNELDDLRNRGLAKVLNRHFTDTTKKLAKEKAAADAAIADLERRRANTSEFVPSKGGELNPFDSMYVQLQQKRAECRRKERETLLLYQRYVHKYGNKAKPVELSPATSTASTPEAPPPPSPVPSRGFLQSLDENKEEVDAQVTFSKFYNKQIQEAKDPPTKTPDSKFADLPDLQDLTPQASRESGASDPPELSGEVLDEHEESCFVKKLDAKRPYAKADPPVDPPAVKFAKQAETPKAQNIETTVPDLQTNVGLGWGKALFANDEECAVAKETSTRVETVIKGAADRVEIGSNSSDCASNRPTREVTTEIPALEAEDEEEDDRSIISGLTMSSQVTRQVIEEIEKEMTRFLNTETEAIRQLLDEEEEDEQTMESNALNGSIVGDESRRASMKAEAMALEMQKILDEYAKEDLSESPLATEESEADADTVATTGYPRKYDTSDPTKEWMIYYDESFQREYYYETTTQTTQWEPPLGGLTTMHSLSEEVAPSFMRTTSRRDLYRKRIRKRKMRRIALFMLVTLSVGGTVFHWQQNHDEKTYPQAMVATWRSTSEVALDYLDASLYALAEGAEFLNEQIEYSLTDRKAKEEAQELAEMDQARKAQELAAERARAEADQQRKEEEANRIKEQQQREEAESVEDVEKNMLQTELVDDGQKVRDVHSKTDEEGKQKKAEPLAQASRGRGEDQALQRPWGCFLPLSYVHPRCNRLAKLKPLYKDTDVLNSFLQ